ncbi:aminotransferase class I/II-fold pyridoxal phosphate-dependent enzyme [Shimia abyssi]|uniref:Glycine C-acetyltransferase n=1 Tax=Shimia abyssi TaxID=1662395 RepID=A0A2P8FFP2_9RHOB|nr:aminotransferase class I/II-fold pyridoxal phosphate-dependent enzyme [Shimia abyssi]PSL20535.1 glycine C-acetyltransferase [Shimia abyssi]
MQVVDDYYNSVMSADVDPDEFVVRAKSGNRATIECARTGNTHDVLNFCHNDIFGFSQNRAVKDAAIQAIEDFGTSNSGCMALCGRSSPHEALEQEIARFKGVEHTHLFLNAWMALQAFMDGFCHLAKPVPGFRNDRPVLVMTDVLNHGCITSAAVNASSRSGKVFTKSPPVHVHSYKHCDMSHLRKKLKALAQPDDRILLLTDSVFSMDGTIVPLPEMVDILSNYPGSTLVLDEAHASGAIGAHGGGICEYHGMSPADILARGVNPVILTTFSKFAGSAGAAISGFSKGLERLMNACPTSIGTISLPPSAAASAAEAIRQLHANPELVTQLQSNARFARHRLGEVGFEVLGETNVLPIVLPGHVPPKHAARHLIEDFGIWVSPIWYIARPRMRAVINAQHSEQDILQLTRAMTEMRSNFEPRQMTAGA